LSSVFTTSERSATDELPLAGRHSWLPLLVLFGFIVLAAILRIIATHNDLWLDELISLRIVDALHTPGQIFTAVHIDNNHYLNTLYLYLVRSLLTPNQNDAPTCRYLSVVLGVAVVPAGYWLLVRRSRVEAVILAGLLACSYPLIHFSSEARGYSGAVLGSMLACAALARWMKTGGESRKSFALGLIYASSLVLAVLSHLTACLIWFPLAAGSLITLACRSRRGRWIALWVALNVLPASVLAALYFFDLRYWAQLGGPPMTVLHGLGRLLALGMGWPAKDAATIWIVIVPLMVLAIWQLVKEYKAGEPLATLLMLIYLMLPLCVLMLEPSFFSPRYFLIFLPFFYVPMAMLLARLTSTRAGRLTCTAILALFLVGQANLYVKFLRVGRGQFTAALQYIMTHTPSQQLFVTSNQDFRSQVELNYYVPRILTGRQLAYLPSGSQSSPQPDWYIFHEEGYDPPGPATLNVPGQPTWHRAAYFGAAELSGQAWTIYSHSPN
jgi:hypothetical protein